MSILRRRMRQCSLLLFVCGLRYVAGDDVDVCDLPFVDVASRTVLADVVFSGQCLAVSHVNSSAFVDGPLDFTKDAVTLTFLVNRTLKGLRRTTLFRYLFRLWSRHVRP